MTTTLRAFVAAILTQQARDRTSFFFMIVLPLAIIVIIGSTFGGATELEIAVVGAGDRAEQLVAELDAAGDVQAELRSDLTDVQRDIRRFDVEAALVVNADGTYGFIANPTSEGGFAARSTVQRIVDRVEAGVADGDELPIIVESVGEARFASQGAFALTSAQNLVLFTFITALTSSAILVRMRRAGVLRRSLASPVGTTAITLGVGAGWMVLALLQTVIIIAVGALGFDVDWGDPIAAAILVLVFCLVGTGAGLLVGAVFSSEDTVSSATPPIALVLAAIGGCMVPSEVFPDIIRTISKATPHYWALEAWKELMFDGVGLADIAQQLAILSGFAAVLVGFSSWALRRSLVA